MVVDGSPRLTVFAVFGEFMAFTGAARVQRMLIMLAVLATSFAQGGRGGAAEAFGLRPSLKPDQQHRVRVVLEVSGDLKLNPDGKKVTRLPLKVKGELLYDERLLAVDAKELRRRDVRYYDQARGAIRVGENLHEVELGADSRLVVAEISTGGLFLFSPLGPLTRDELELIDVPASSTLLSRLLPNRDVKIGDRWAQDQSTLAALLGLDAVTQADVESTLREVEGNLAVISIAGSVSGAIRGISSDLEIEAKYNFDRDRGQVTWLAMSLKENRSVGHAEPGLEAVSRLRIAIAPGAPCPEISDTAIRGLPLSADPGASLLRFGSPQDSIHFLYGRQWRVMVDRHDVTIMRLVDRGDLIAQCNASKLANLPAGQRVQLEAFQADIQRALGDSFGQFVEASQSESERGLRILRAVASGVTSELPIHWTYYHLSDDHGRQAALVFTMDARLVERFAEADRTIVSSLDFAAPPNSPSAKPASADEAAETARRKATNAVSSSSR